MRCPDWPSLIDRREHDTEGELLWGRALEHFDGCEACRETAYAAEPTLIFRRLPTVTPPQSEIDAMKQAVAALRRAQPIVEPARQRRSRRRFEAANLMRAAAAVAMVTGGALLYNVLGPGDLDPLVPSRKDLQIGIHVLKASKVDAPMPEESAPSPELLARLRAALVDYEVFQVLGQKDVSSREGAQEVADLGGGFTASFKMADVREDGRILLRDFEIIKEPVVKSGHRDEPVRMLLLPELEVTCERPANITVPYSDPNRDAVVLAITCRWETGSDPL